MGSIPGKISLLPGVIALFSTLLSPALAAQTAETGAIAGKLADVKGPAIAGATVTSVNVATSQLRTATTDNSGAYAFALLQPGVYTVRFSAAGYVTARVEAIALRAGDALVIDQALSSGSQAQEVVVQWEAPAVQAATSATGARGAEASVKALPLASRNYTQAAGLDAGVSSQVNNATAIGINTQGVQVGGGNTSNYMMDGASVAATTGGADSPGIANPDAIQEYKVQSWTYDAGPERYSGANISVVTKSGTNSFHGTLFEFVRNDIFNANDFFIKRAGLPEPVLKQNQFGFTFGGPIWINKLFFFASYQGTRQRNGFSLSGFSPNVVLPPLPATRTAATVGAAFCPANNPGVGQDQTLFGGVQVACDGSNVNPVALNLLNLKLSGGSYFIPGSGAGAFLTVPFTIPAKFQEDQFLINADYAISSKHTVTAKFFYSRDPQLSNFTGGPDSLPGSPTDTVTGNIYGVARLASTLTANLSNEIRISGQHDLLTDTPLVSFTDQQVGIAPAVPQIGMLSGISITGLFSQGGNGAWDHNSINQYQLSDQVSWLHGKHAIRVGFEADRRQWNVTVLGDARGGMDFMSFADFLLGLPGCPPGNAACSAANPVVNGIATNGSHFSNVYLDGANVTGPDGIDHAYRFSDYSGYILDGVKLTPRFTLNLGLRWEYFSLPMDVTGNSTSFWPSLALTDPIPPAAGTYLGFVVPANFKGQVPPSVYRNTLDTPIPIRAPFTNFAPRVGFAWQPLATSRWAVRGGYGLFYDRPDAATLLGQTLAAAPYAAPIGAAGAANYQASLAQPFLPTALGWGLARQVDFTTGQGSNLNLPMLDEHFSTPRSQKWSLEMQEQLPSHWALMVGYAGSHAIRLQDTGRQINEAVLAGAATPVNGITVNTVENASLRVPYLGIAPNGLMAQQTAASAKYNSLQATLVKQPFHGLQAQAAYTFSKTLSTISTAPPLAPPPPGFPGSPFVMNSNDPLDARQQYGPVSPPQRLAVNYSWEPPYKGIGVRGELLGGWSASGVTIVQDGSPMTIVDSRGGTIYGSAGISRAQFCTGMGAGNIATSGAMKNRLGAFFNTAAFCAPPAIGDGAGYGNSSPGMILGPGQANTDLSVKKSLTIKESKVELRVELFNAFNHPQFANPDTIVTDPNFGAITGTSVNPRLIQFAVKYSF
jgi:hypothetical protein